MRRLLVFAILFLATGTFVFAQEEVPLTPKAPKASAAKMIIIDAVRTTRQLTEAEDKIAAVEVSTSETATLIKAHNSQYPGGVCSYSDKDPHACDAWIAESGELNTKMADLKKQHEADVTQKMMLRANLNMRLARLRIMAVLDGLSSWEQEVVRCSKLPGVPAARACMTAAWEHHP